MTSSRSIRTLPSTAHSYSSILPFSVTYFATTMVSVRQHRLEKGLCFRCGKQFWLGHRCVRKFSLMEIDEAGNPMPKTPEAVDELGLELLEEAKISFNVILGKPTSTTMKLSGSILSRDVLFLVDSGSTHKFISESLVHQLTLPTSVVSTFDVQIGNGSVVHCSHICNDEEVQLPGLSITQDFYPFSLVGSDLVLGIKWLASLNTIQVNWNEMFLIF